MTHEEIDRYELLQASSAAAQATQVSLRLQYQQAVRVGALLPSFADVEFRCYSQNSEDGILLFLFSVLGIETRRALEICCGNGIECNAANLVINHGWQAMLVDGNPAQIEQGRAFYARCRSTLYSPPTLVASWITADNVNDLVRAHGFDGDIDLLSLDLDGNDYWIWLALTAVRPRVVVLEFNALLGPHERLTLPYQPDFQVDFALQPPRCGASLPAFTALATSRGYKLVGVQSLGFNAFFVREDLAPQLPAVTPEECFRRVERLRGFSQAWIDEMHKGGQRWEAV